MVIRPLVAVKLINSKNGKEITTYAMLDTGSDRDVISEDIILDLELEQRKRPVTIQTVESSTTDYRRFVDLRIESLDSSYGADINDALVGKLLTGDSDLPPAKRDLSALQHLDNVDFIDIDADISMIIGVSHAEAWAGAEIRRGTARQPLAMKTCFGWTLVGGWAKSDSMHIAYQSTIIDNTVLHQDFEKIFYHDFATVSEEELGESQENKDAIAQLMASIRFDDEKGKYRIGLPWKHGRKVAIETQHPRLSTDGVESPNRNDTSIPKG